MTARIAEIALGVGLAYIAAAALIAAAILHAAHDIEPADPVDPVDEALADAEAMCTPLADEVEEWLASQTNQPRHHSLDHQEPR